ncbi:MAG: type II toxin-antitoxin system RelE/ParE family toxin [Longimicrobiaceae bacterium]
MRSVDWHPLALEELHEAAETYKAQRDGRDSRFLAAVEATTELIRRSPLIARSVHGEHRGVLVHRFPYTLIYRVRAKSVQVIAVAHDKREPLFWLGR